MSSELRDSGISVVGEVPWGTHFCHFYETKQDLLDTLVPYFKTGLESNECCLWVVSGADLITIEEATRALAQVVPDLDRQLSDGNIEILSAHQWYLEKNAPNLERVRSAWDAKLKQALARGYEGLRVSGDTFWLADKDWKDFCDYEKQLNDSITDQPMTVLCTYPLAKSAAAEILDVVQAHQFAIARRQGEWEVIQSPEPPQARTEIKRLNEELNRVLDRSPKPPAILRYGVAVLAVVVALTINRLLNINLVGAPSMLFLCALMFGAWYGGARPSLLAMPLAVLAFAYYFVTPVNSWSVDVRQIPRLSLFVLASLFVISLSAAQRRAAESRRHARDVLAGTVEELKRTNQALHTENVERKQAEKALDERLRFETLLTELSAAFANLSPNEVDREIDKWLQTLTEFLSVDRATFFQFEDDWTTLYRSHSYTVPGIEPLPSSIGMKDQFPWITDQLRRGVTVKWSRIPDDMPEQAAREREYAAKVGVKSGLNIPVRMAGSVICAISFTSLATYRDWPDELVARIRLVGEIFATAIQRKRTEVALRQSEEQFRQVAENIREVFWLATGDLSKLLYISPTYEVVWGRSRESLYREPRSFYSAIHPDDRPRVIPIFERDRERGFEVEYRVQRPDGSIRWIRDRGFPIKDESSHVYRLAGIAEDITNSERAEEELKREKEVLEKIFANIPLMIGFVGEDGRVKLVNPEWERTIGWTLKELQEQNVDIFAEAYPDLSYRQEILDFVAASTGEWVDLKIKVRDGRVIDAACAVVGLSDGTRVAIAQDITERKQAEEALKQSQRRLEEAQRIAHVGHYEQNLETGVVISSDEMYRILGLEPQEGMTTAGAYELIHPDDRDPVRQAREEAVRERRGWVAEFRVLRPDGQVRYVRTQNDLLYNEEGRPRGSFGTVQDITERKLADEALRKSEDLWRTIFNDAAIGIAIVNPEGRPVETNPTIQKILGYTREELRHLWFVDFTHPDDTIKEFPLHQEMIEGKRDHYQMEKRYIRKDGQVRWVNLIASVIPAEQPGEFFGVGMVEDITERKLAEDQLQAKSEQLRALSARFESAKEEESMRIAREIHDELGATLTTLRWDLEELGDALSAVTEPNQAEALRTKVSEIMRVTDTTVNTVRRIASELHPVALDTLGLGEAIEVQAREFQERTGITVVCDCTQDGEKLSPEQATALFRIFQEAMTNILRHAQATSVEIQLKEENNEAVLTIRDNGRGITEEEKWNRRTLGLLGMRERAHLLGGDIAINGSKEEGTTVVVRIPLTHAAGR